MKTYPLYDKLEVEPIIEAESKSGIILASSDKEKPELGKVISVGGGRVLNNGVLMPLTVKVGDTVVFRKYAADIIEKEGKKYYFIQESDVLAIVE